MLALPARVCHFHCRRRGCIGQLDRFRGRLQRGWGHSRRRGAGHLAVGLDCSAGRSRAIGPRARNGRFERGSLRFYTQHALYDFAFGLVVAADIGQPTLVKGRIIDALQRSGNTTGQGHGDLRAKAGGQVQGILHRITAAAAQIERSQIRIHLLEIRHRRHNAMFQDLDGDDIFHADAHRMAGEAFRIGDDDIARRLAECFAQSDDFGRCAAAARRRIGLVGHEDHILGHGVAIQAETPFGRGDQVVHDHGDMVDIEARAVEGAV